MAMFGKIAVPPDGTHFLLIAMVVVATLVGKVFTLARLPALLGMLVTGIVLNNLPGVSFDEHWQSYSQTLRGVALVVILLRAGLGLDPVALRRLSGKLVLVQYFFIACLKENLVTNKK
jgi:Kef-type K+ transport system membrane component KefB